MFPASTQKFFKKSLFWSWPLDHYLDKLKGDITKDSQGKMTFKSNHPLKGNNNIDSIKVTFIDKIVENLNTRFPKGRKQYSLCFWGAGASANLPPISKWLRRVGKKQVGDTYQPLWQGKGAQVSLKLVLAEKN